MSSIPSACKYHACVGACYAFFVPFGTYFVKTGRDSSASLSRWLMSRYHAHRMRKYLSIRLLYAFSVKLIKLRVITTFFYIYLSGNDIIDRIISINRARGRIKFAHANARESIARPYCYSRLFSLQLIGASERGARRGRRQRGRCKYSSEIDQSCEPNPPEAFASIVRRRRVWPTFSLASNSAFCLARRGDLPAHCVRVSSRAF